MIERDDRFVLPDAVPREISRRSSVGDVVVSALGTSVRRLIELDPLVRLGEEPEALHHARVATRRLHANLRTFGDLFDPAWRRATREEFGWLVDTFGAARDLDVIMARLRSGEPILPSAAGGRKAEAVLEALREARERAGVELTAVMRSDRYVALIDRAVEAAQSPALQEAASTPAKESLPVFVRRTWREVRTYERSIRIDPSDRQLHRLRIKTRRMRYAAEVAVPVFGARAQAFTEAATDLQDALGEACDAFVAQAWLERWSAAGGGSAAPDPGSSVTIRHDEAWRRSWDRLSAKRLRSWL